MAAIQSKGFHRSSSSEEHSISLQHQIPSPTSSHITMGEKRGEIKEKEEREKKEGNENDDCTKENVLWIESNLTAPFPINLTCKSLIKLINQYCLSYSNNQKQEINSSIPIYHRASSRFYRHVSPEISIHDYLIRIVSFLPILEPAILLSIIVYSNRSGFNRSTSLTTTVSSLSKSSFSSLVLDNHSWHRFIIAVVCLASKALGDYYYTNIFYAKVGGISPRELRLLELELAERLEWHLQIEQSEFIEAFEMINRDN